MAASSVTGTGPGSAEFYNSQQLTTIVSGPANIVYVGQAQTSQELLVSPPMNLATVHFQHPLPDGASHYAVFLTSINGGWIQLVDMIEDSAGFFIGFGCASEAECFFNYMVVKSGNKLN